MGVVVTPESELGKEMAKWEKPYRFQMFPKMVYRAAKDRTGKTCSIKGDPAPWGYADPAQFQRDCDEVAQWNKSNQRIVQNEDEERAALNDGWRPTPVEALEAFEAREQAIGNAAAERAFRDRSMSEKAQREAASADAEAFEHLPEIPRTPTRGRPRKSEA